MAENRKKIGRESEDSSSLLSVDQLLEHVPVLSVECSTSFFGSDGKFRRQVPKQVCSDRRTERDMFFVFSNLFVLNDHFFVVLLIMRLLCSHTRSLAAVNIRARSYQVNYSNFQWEHANCPCQAVRIWFLTSRQAVRSRLAHWMRFFWHFKLKLANFFILRSTFEAFQAFFQHLSLRQTHFGTRCYNDSCVH